MISLKKLTKRYGKTLALDALDLEIGEGELHGFVGPNGAGKTTAMRILATLMRPTSGDALVNGVSVVSQPQKARLLVGYMPDFFGVYDNLKAWEYLDFYAGCVGMNVSTRRRRIDELLELTALDQKREAYVDHLSRGMKQRLCLARALMHDPQLLILDEPASGMDPRARAEMRDILKNVGGMGKTVLISSHILPELSELCTSMSIIERGRLVFTGSADTLDQKIHGGEALVLRFAHAPDAALREKLVQLAGTVCNAAPTSEQEDTLWRIAMPGSEQTDAKLLRGMMDLGAPLCAFHREKPTLEEVFMEVTRG